VTASVRRPRGGGGACSAPFRFTSANYRKADMSFDCLQYCNGGDLADYLQGALLLCLWQHCEVLWRLCLCMSVGVSVCMSVCPRQYLWNHMRDLYENFCALPMALARSSSGVIAIRDVLPVLWMTSYFLYNGLYRPSGLNFASKDKFCLNLLIYREFGHNLISCY